MWRRLGGVTSRKRSVLLVVLFTARSRELLAMRGLRGGAPRREGRRKCGRMAGEFEPRGRLPPSSTDKKQDLLYNF